MSACAEHCSRAELLLLFLQSLRPAERAYCWCLLSLAGEAALLSAKCLSWGHVRKARPHSHLTSWLCAFSFFLPKETGADLSHGVSGALWGSNAGFLPLCLVLGRISLPLVGLYWYIKPFGPKKNRPVRKKLCRHKINIEQTGLLVRTLTPVCCWYLGQQLVMYSVSSCYERCTKPNPEQLYVCI